MTRIVAIGRVHELAGYALAGVDVIDASDPDGVQHAWASLTDDVSLVLVTAEARAALPERLGAGDPLWAVIPA